MLGSSYQEYLSQENSQLLQMKVGLFSIILGMIIAGAIIHIIPQDLSSVEKAREMGVFGKTVIDGYPKQSEIPYYIFGVIISLLSSLSLFFGITYFYYKRKEHQISEKSLSISIGDIERLSPKLEWFHWFGLILSILLITFNKDYIYNNWNWGEWGFFYEEGVYFRWISELLRGKILYKEIDFHGGPFLIWPQYWLMKLLGPSISLHRYYGYFCYFLGYLIVFKICYELIRNKVLILICMLLIIYVYYPMYPSHHESLLRYAFSLIPLWFLYKSFFSNKLKQLLVCGICLGFALSYSQELGLASLAAVFAMLLVFNYREESLFGDFFKQLVIIAIGIIFLLIPITTYFYYHNALFDLYEIMMKMPQKLYVFWLGMPFPNLFQLFYNSTKSQYGALETLLAYWPIAFYIGSIFLCITLFLRKVFTNRIILLFGISTLGAIIFQRAFGIYDLNKIEKMSFPLIIISIVLLDMLYSHIRYLLRKKYFYQGKQEILLFLILVSSLFFGLYGYSLYGIWPISYRVNYMLGYDKNYTALNIQRAENISVPPQWAYTIRHVVRYIMNNTQPDEPIFVFPYSPIYYYLTNRPSASKFSVGGASQRRHREHIVRDLEEKNVKYIIYPLHRQSVLGVDIQTRFPEIITYIGKNYETELEIDDTIILRRK